MAKNKLNWLDKFAEEQAAKLQKVASTTKVAEGEDVIVSPEDVPGATDGAVVEFNGEKFEVINASFSDDFGPGVVLRAAAYEGLEQDPMGMAMGAPATSVSPAPAGQQYSRNEGNPTQQTYTNDEDAQWGSSSAPATEQQIAGENSVDRTTIPGKFTPSPELAGAAPVVPGAQAVPVQGQPAAQEAPAQDAPVQDAQPAAQDPAAQGDAEVQPEVQDAAPAQEVQEVQDAPAQDAQPAQGEEDKEPKIANRILARILAKQGK